MKKIVLFFILLLVISCGDNIEEDSCNDVTCSGNGECGIDTSTKEIFCVCDTGYHSKGLKCIEDGVSPCSENPCTEKNRTVCQVVSDDYICDCDDGYGLKDDKCVKMDKFNLRLMAANTTTGKYSEYNSDGIRIFQAIDPDVIMIQEFSYSNSIENLVEKIYGNGCLSQNKCYFYRGDRSKPNGIISKYPIIDHGFWRDSGYSDRNLDWAIINIPGKIELYVISVHLSTKGSEQVAPARKIAGIIAKHKAANPGKYYYAVGGDFNGSSAVNGFISEGAFTSSDPKPESEKCRKGKKSKKAKYKCTNTNHNRSKHYDWILESSNLSKLRVATKLCHKTNPTDCLIYPKGLVFDTREYVGKSDYISPARLGDSEDQYMQHMAIIKDFEIKF